MANIIESIITSNFQTAKTIFEDIMNDKITEQILVMKKYIGASIYSNEVISEGRTKVVKLRIRNGKVQRRKKVSNVTGMKMQSGKLVRMSPSERRKRKLAAKKTAIKVRSKKAQANRKRKLSMMKRKRLGF